jgi:restriction endonuclease Mrr
MGIRHRDFAVEAVQFRPAVDENTERSSTPTSLTPTYKFTDLLAGAKRIATPTRNRIENVRLTDEILQFLRLGDDALFKLSPDQFELLICDRLVTAGFEISRAGHTFARDGGIDILACPRHPMPFPYILAVQVKHHRRQEIKTGAPDVQQFVGAISSRYEIQAGALITNTTFTPDAPWLAQHASKLTMLRDVKDIRRWLQGNFVALAERRDLPSEIVLGQNIVVRVPRLARIPDLESNPDGDDAASR